MDDDGDYKAYACEYTFGNSQWALTIHARSWEEAEERLKRIGAFGRVKGEHITTIPAFAGPFVPIIVWLRNWWSRP